MYDSTSTVYITTDPTFMAYFAGPWLIFWIIFLILVIAGLWKVFSKAKQPGWAAIIPLYNIYILLKTVGRPGWWLILYFIPFVNIVISIIVSVDLAKSFGKSGAYGFFLVWLLNPIGFLTLGFGSAKYVRAAAK